MKKQLIFFPAILVAVAIATVSCDRIALPVQQNNSTQTTNNPKTVLIEHFVGHFCPQCENGADTLQSLMNSYPGQIVPLDIHAGLFAVPANVPFAPLPACISSNPGSFLTDYRTTLGNEIDSVYGASNWGLPCGMVNRKTYGSWGHIYGISQWRDTVAAILQRPQLADVQINPAYNQNTRILNVHVQTDFLQNINSTNGFSLCVVLTEDSIFDWFNQMGNCVPNYRFDHVLRADISGAGMQGIHLVSGNVQSNTMLNQQINGFNVQQQWVDAHCNVVAYVYNEDNGEIVQAGIVPLY